MFIGILMCTHNVWSWLNPNSQGGTCCESNKLSLRSLKWHEHVLSIWFQDKNMNELLNIVVCNLFY
jgi:hypothetical protein